MSVNISLVSASTDYSLCTLAHVVDRVICSSGLAQVGNMVHRGLKDTGGEFRVLIVT